MPRAWELRARLVLAGDVAGGRAAGPAVPGLVLLDAAAHLPHPHFPYVLPQVSLPSVLVASVTSMKAMTFVDLRNLPAGTWRRWWVTPDLIGRAAVLAPARSACPDMVLRGPTGGCSRDPCGRWWPP